MLLAWPLSEVITKNQKQTVNQINAAAFFPNGIVSLYVHFMEREPV